MSVNWFVSRLDSAVSGKIFMYSIMYSYAKSAFENRHEWISKLPLASRLFGLSVSTAFIGIATVLSAAEPFVMFLWNAYGRMKSVRLSLEFSVGAHHFALLLLLLAFAVWLF